jgi:hypothetical protein
MNWFFANWTDVLDIFAYVIAAASIVVKFTPTKIDDKWVGKIALWLSLARKIKK